MDALRNRPVSPKLLHYLTLLLALAVAPNYFNLSIWITGLFYLVAVLRLLLWSGERKPPSGWLMVPLTIVGVIIVLSVAGYTEGRQFGVALLVIMMGLKLLESRTRRDLYVIVTLGYFLLITLFLFDQSIALSIYAFLLSIGFTALLVTANRTEEKVTVLPALRTATVLTLGAIPIMILLFVFFPRMEGPLWHLNLGGNSGLTGMSDHINMGSVGKLSLSNEVAFRVKFKEGYLPAPEQRYWRGMALSWTDGNNWSRGYQRRGPPELITPLDDPVGYTVTMEPTGQNWLFPLDRILSAQKNTQLSPLLELSAANPIDRRFSYEASSSLDFWAQETTRGELAAALQLPSPKISNRMRQLVSDWKLNANRDQDLVAAALAHFTQQPYIYTLQPPVLGKNPLDEFLFETRKGFCEHYATSFVVLMRLAGIPARVVVGYLGGEWNPHGEHLIIRQSDAHAWAEVWLEDSGWVRIDPTAAIAPERIERSIDPSLLGEGAPVLFRFDGRDLLSALMLNASWLNDSIQLYWHHWVIGYNQSRQNTLLSGLGLDFLDPSRKSMISIFGTLVITGLLFALLMWRMRFKPEPAVAAYRKFQDKLRKAGLEIPPWLGPEDLARAAAQRFPGQSKEITAIVQLYVGLRYGRTKTRSVQSHLLRRVRQFRPG